MPAGLHYFCVIKDNAFGHDAKIVAEASHKSRGDLSCCSLSFFGFGKARNQQTYIYSFDRFAQDELEICIDHTTGLYKFNL